MPVRPMHLRLPPAPARPGPRRAGAALLAAAAAGLMAGCSVMQLPMQRAAPAAWAPGLAGGEACVVENPAVGLDLLAYLRASLAERGFTVRQLPPGSMPGTCTTTVFYTASWGRDASARVLATAQLRVWRGGRMASEAVYDATRSSLLDLRRYRSAEARIDGMVDQLFPTPVAVVPAVPPAPAPVPTAQPQVIVPVTVPVAVPMPVAAPVAVPVPASGPIFIPGPGEPAMPVPAPVPTSPLAPGGAGRGSTPF